MSLWNAFFAGMFGPPRRLSAELDMEQLAQWSEPPSEPLQPELPPALLRLAERVHWALCARHITQADVVDVIAEALWQIAHAVREGQDVEIPEVGTLRWVPLLGAGGARLEFTPDHGLYEEND